MYEIDDIDEAYEAVDDFSQAVDRLSYFMDTEVKTFVDNELSPAMEDAEEAIDDLEYDEEIEALEQDYREARKELWEKSDILEFNDLDLQYVQSASDTASRFAYHAARGEVSDSIL